jgi:serine/threonine protein kinase
VAPVAATTNRLIPHQLHDDQPDFSQLRVASDLLRHLGGCIRQRYPHLEVPHKLVVLRAAGEIAHGAFGSVHRCLYGGTPHVIKRIDLGALLAMGIPAPRLAEMVFSEVTSMVRLQHRHLLGLPAICLVPVDAVCETEVGKSAPLDDCEIWLVLPEADGGSLRSQYLRIGPNKPLVLRLLRQVAEALVFMHAKGTAHLDLKPDNILLDDATFPRNALLADLGLAQQAGYRTGSVLPFVARGYGTPFYAPRPSRSTPVSAPRFASGPTCFPLASLRWSSSRG